MTTPAQRVDDLLATYTDPAACVAGLLCDRHPTDKTAFTLVETDLSTRDLTYGAQRFLEIARAVARRPDVLVLDEPAAGLSHPDMVRQMKVRAQAPLGFFADGRGSRVPVTGTIPIGYEVPKANAESSPGARQTAFQHQLQRLPRLHGRGQWNHQTVRPNDRGQSAGRTDSQNVGRRNFQHDHERQEYDAGLRTERQRLGSLGNHRLPARVATEPERDRDRRAAGASRGAGQAARSAFA